jgi:asparagine synthase (glutamine-hydrolysing)
MSSEIDPILSQPEIERRICRETVAEFLLVSHPRHQIHDTLYERIRRLPSGHLLEFSGRRPEVERYWDPLPDRFQWADEDEVREIPKKLETAVSRCLEVGGNALALSGGFDSVSLAAVAGELRRERDEEPLLGISLRFPEGPCDEGGTQAAVASALGMPQRLMTIDESLAGRNAVDESLAISRSLPSPVLSPWQSIYSGLFRAAGSPGELQVLMGTGGDDMFLVDPSYGADCLRSLRLAALWRYVRSWLQSSPFGAAVVSREILIRGAIKPTIMSLAAAVLSRVAPGLEHRMRERRFERTVLPEWFSRADGTLIASLYGRQKAPGLAIPQGPGSEYVHAMRSLPFRPLLLLELEQAFAWGRVLGTRFLYPFFDRDLVEASLRIHPENLIAGGRSKAPLRRLVARRLPGVTLPGRKVDFSQMLNQVLRAQAGEPWGSLLGDLCLETAGLVDGERLEQAVRRFLAGHSDDWRPAWFGLSTEHWLRQQNLSW